MAILEVKNLAYSYPGSSVPAIRDVSFSLNKGDYMAIVGANGSGKSTLIRCLNGLCMPPSGRVSVLGADPASPEGLIQARKTIALIFQSPEDQLVASVVEEDVAFGLENQAVPPIDMKKRVKLALEAVGLESEKANSPRFLSAGQQQRLAIAGALAMAPDIIAFDEATSMIDPAGRSSVLNLIDKLAHKGTAIIHVTHDMDEAARAKTILALDRGRMAFLGSTEKFFASGMVRSLRLDLPVSWLIAESLGLKPLLAESPVSLAKRAIETGHSVQSIEAGIRKEQPSFLSRHNPKNESSLENLVDKENPAAFELDHVSMRYMARTEYEKTAIRDISVSLPKGKRIALIGITGSGKSSLLELLSSLILPDEGRVYSLGQDTKTKGLDLRRLRMRAALSIQRPERALFESFAGDEVAFGPRNQGLKGEALVKRVKMAMDKAGLPFDLYRDGVTRTLSGGKKRLLALASILALEPDFLLLDEPGASLDPATKKEILSVINSFPGGVLMSTHSMEDALAADYILVLVNGSMAAFGSPDHIFNTAWEESWGLEKPFSLQVLDILKKYQQSVQKNYKEGA